MGFMFTAADHARGYESIGKKVRGKGEHLERAKAGALAMGDIQTNAGQADGIIKFSSSCEQVGRRWICSASGIAVKALKR